jgi:hypothetical protein
VALGAASPVDERRNASRVALTVLVAEAERRQRRGGAVPCVGEIPEEGDLNTVAPIVVVAREVEQGEYGGIRRGAIRRSVVEGKEQGRNRILVAEAPEQREDNGVASVLAAAEEGEREKPAARPAVGEAAVVKPQRKDARRSQLSFGELRLK